MKVETGLLFSVSNDVLRVVVGLVLFVVAASFIEDSRTLEGLISGPRLPFVSFVLSHLVIAAHLAGGVMLVFGFLTRIAAALQIPILLGAFGFFVFGDFPADQYLVLNLSPIVLLSLINIFVSGPGWFSVDRLIGMETVDLGSGEDSDVQNGTGADLVDARKLALRERIGEVPVV
ncbi:MAG: DoxX family protein [Silvanigrellaceae bacterium]